jgi:uncharacterized protein
MALPDEFPTCPLDHAAPWCGDYRLPRPYPGFYGRFAEGAIRTVFKDLLPRDDPFVKLYLAHLRFGNPMTTSQMVKRKHGDIDRAPGIDHDQIISIATEKLRYAEATADGVDTQPVMDDFVPLTFAEMQDFKRRVNMSINARTFYISVDELDRAGGGFDQHLCAEP